jgi:hypothetical protein
MSNLLSKMRRLADNSTTLSQEDKSELYRRADELEARIKIAYQGDCDNDDIKSMLGAWARARMLWCKLTGFPLV